MLKHLVFEYRFFERFRHLLIDATHREEIPDAWQAVPVAPAFLGEDTARCPLLVDTQALSEVDRGTLLDRLEAEVSAGQEAFVSLALATTGSSRVLLSHLKSRLVVRDPVDRTPKQFRYFDPGTFLQLPDLLGAPGMAWLLGPIDAIAVPWLGEWSVHERSDYPEQGGFDLRIHWDSLQAVSVINRVLIRLPEIGNQAQWQQTATRTRQHVVRARQHRLQSRDDLVAFALHAWQWYPEFDRHPTIRKLLAELTAATPDDELDYRELTARLDEAEWTQIAQDLRAETNQQGIQP